MRQSLRIRVGVLSRRSLTLALCCGLATVVGCKRETESEVEGPPSVVKEQTDQTQPDESRTMSGRDVFDRMVDVYQNASSYSDAGTVHLLAEAGRDKFIDDPFDYSLTLVRPNKIRLQAYLAKLVCNGETLYAEIKNQPQILERPAPKRVTLRTLLADRVLAMDLTQGVAGLMPQLVLLLADDPTKALLQDGENPVLAESGQIEGRDCYRVQVAWPEGTVTFWIDQETFVLRRIVFPTEGLLRAISQERPVDHVSLVAEFSGAQIDGKIDPKAFEFEVPEGAEIVKFFSPPHSAQLLGKEVPDFEFFSLDGKPITPESLAGKVVAFDFWATWCGPCKRSLPGLQKVYEQYKDNPKVAFYAVSVDRPDVPNEDLVKLFEDLKVTVPILRAAEESTAPFKFIGVPTMFIVGADGVVQDYTVGGNPEFAEALPEKLDKLLAGENIYEKPLKEYQDQLDQYAKMIEASAEDGSSTDEPVVEERKLPEVTTAQRSEPSTLKLTPLWKCEDVTSPGNMIVLGEKDGSARLAVVEGWKSIAEVGADGKRIALHELNLAEKEVVGSLRSAVDANGKRYTVAFLTTQQRCHLLDEDWKQVVSYPEDALENPHSGIADVEIGDLEGDGSLEMYVSYWGVVGIQAVSLEGKRLQSNRSASNVLGMAIGPPNKEGRRELVCTNSTGSLVVFDAQLQRQREIRIPNQMLHRIVAADLRGDGQPSWCGMAAPRLGENVAVGVSLAGEELWNYPLPPGVQPRPIEPITSGRITQDGPGQWILPGPDGSIHIVSADGEPIDQFNYGATLQGLATVEIDGQPALVVASENGLEAWRVEKK